jgi:trigger factor
LEKKVNVISDYENEIEVTLEYDEIKSEIDEAYKKERKSISHPGFRKGKVPPAVLKKVYGDAIEYKASEDIANKKFWELVKSDDLDPISTPQLTDLKFEPGSKLAFKVKYEVMPTLELKNYKGVEVDKPIFKVKDEDVDREVEHLLKSNASYEDYEIVEDEGFKITTILQRVDENENPIAGSRSENIEIDLGVPTVNPEIVESAKGKKVGDTFKFTFVDEHKHGEEVHKEEYKYEAELTKIQKIKLPETTEEFVQKISKNKAKTIDEFKAQIRDNFEKYFEGQSDNIFTNSLLNKIIEDNDFTPPPGYVDSWFQRLFEYEKQNAQRNKTPNFNEAAVKEQLKPRSVWTAKWQIILDNIAKAENIKVEESDLQELAEKEAATMGLPAEKLIDFYKENNRSDAILEDKVLKVLKDNAKIKEFDPEKDSAKKETKKKAAAPKKSDPKTASAKSTKSKKDDKE